jgi:ubiquinone/menaquinone biosynthesis C-methylase UbiE
MNSPNICSYRCPETSQRLIFEGTVDPKGKPIEGRFRSEDGTKTYTVTHGIPDFIFPKEDSLPQSDLASLEWYKNNAEVYDEFLPLTFQTFKCCEEAEREHLVDMLQITGGEVVLEFGCGTGRDSERIAKRMNENGKLFLQDISSDILAVGVNKFEQLDLKPEIGFSLANGYYLPFADQYFDRVFHFGGLNTFGDQKRTFREIARVCKPGAKVVIGDESMPPWLRDTEFGQVLMNSNPHYKYSLPLEHLPVEARNVKFEWIIGGVFYIMSFEVGEGMPYADFDFEIPGPRGGTHRTRYYGHIEGVSVEARAMASKARKATGKSMYRWLDDAIKFMAQRDLER